MADLSKTDLSVLAKSLQEQVDIITSYLRAEKLPSPTFVPSEDPSKSAISSLPPSIEEARKKAYSLSWGLHTLLSTPDNYITSTAFQVYSTSIRDANVKKFFDVVALRIVLEKNIHSVIPLSSSGVPAKEISDKTGIPEIRLIQILRPLTFIGIFREPLPQIFAHSSTSAYLQAHAPMWKDLLLHTADESYKASSYLPEWIDIHAHEFDRLEKPELRTAFNLALKTDAHFFDWIYLPENVPRHGERFGRALMMGMSRGLLGDLLDQYDWRQFEIGDKIVDVGGGVGHIAVLVKKKVKSGVEVIVQDLPSVVKQGLATPGHKELVEFQAHDFFTQQPVVGAKVYYFRYIMHDWPDRVCQAILSHIVKVMTAESKVLIFDAVWPPAEFWASGKDDKSIIESHTWERGFELIRDMQIMNILGIFQMLF
jgi:hypothetical protein